MNRILNFNEHCNKGYDYTFTTRYGCYHAVINSDIDSVWIVNPLGMKRKINVSRFIDNPDLYTEDGFLNMEVSGLLYDVLLNTVFTISNKVNSKTE